MRATRVLSLSIAFAAASLLASAQSFNQVHVNLPFAISAGSTELPAGNYEIRPVADAPDTFALFKDGIDCKSIVHATRIEKVGADVATSVVLRVNGNRYQLSQLWIDGATGFQFATPGAAKSRDRQEVAPLVIKAHRG